MIEANCYAILFADRLIREDNGKIGVIGLFETFFTPVVPFTPLPWGIFLALDNLPEGQYVLTANLVHEETQAVVLPVSLNLEQKIPGVVQISLPLAGVAFPRFGKYALTVNLDGIQIGSRILTVAQPR